MKLFFQKKINHHFLFFVLLILTISFFNFNIIENKNNNNNQKGNLNFYQPIIQRQQTPKILLKISDNVKYKVKKNDTLYGIAKKFNTTIDELKKANKFNDKTVLKIGMILVIPSKNFIVYSFIDSYELTMKTEKILLIYSKSSIIFSPLDSGIVLYTGEISGFGKSIIIQSNDFSVVISNLYQIFIEKGQQVNLQTCIGFSPVDNVLNLSVFFKEKMLSLKEFLTK